MAYDLRKGDEHTVQHYTDVLLCSTMDSHFGRF